MRLHRTLMAAALAALLSAGGMAEAADFVDWSSATSGVVNSVNVSASYTDTSNLSLNTSWDFSTPDFDPAGSANQESVEFLNKSGITWTFDSPVTNVGLYMKFWRGSGVSGPTDNTYTFSLAPTIKSGLSGGSVSGNDFLTVAGTDWYSGILLFPGPLTSLTLIAPNVNPVNSGVVIYTLAVNVTPVPEPSTYAMAGLGAMVLGVVSGRRKNRKV